MNIFKHLNYRKIVKSLVTERKKSDPSFNFSRLAEAMNTPKSYLSKVLRGDAPLSHDQLYLCCECFYLGAEERDYLMLLLEYDRTAITQRRKELEKKLKQIQTAHSQTKHHIEAQLVEANDSPLSEYYLEPYLQIIHVGLDIPRFQKKPKELAQCLSLSLDRFQNYLKRLVELGLVEKRQGQFCCKVKHMHLNPDSLLYKVWRRQIKSLTVGRLDGLSANESYSYSALFAASPENLEKMRFDFLELLKKNQAQIKTAPSKILFQLNFDLFPWA